MPALWDLYHHPDESIKIASSYSVTIGAGNSFFVSYKSTANTNRIHSKEIPQGLSDFLYEKGSTGHYERDFPKIKVTLGPYNKSWFATDESTTRWHNLPEGILKEINARRGDNGTGPFNDNPRLVALGCDGNYFMATDEGSWAWSLSSYPDLQAIIRGCKDFEAGVSNIKNLVLHPYRLNCWILQTQSGLVVSSGLPPHMEEPFKSIRDVVLRDTEARTALLGGTERENAEKAQVERYRAEQAVQREFRKRQGSQLAQMQQLQRRQNQMAAMTLGSMMENLGKMNFGVR